MVSLKGHHGGKRKGRVVLKERHSMTSQCKGVPTLDGHEWLAVSLAVKSHFPTRARLDRSVPLASHRLALGALSENRHCQPAREHPEARPRLSGGISVRL